MVNESNDMSEGIESIEGLMSMEFHLENETLEDLNETRLNREIELEGMLDEPEEKLSILESNNSLRLQISTIVLSSWGEGKTVQESGATQYAANKSKELEFKVDILPASTGCLLLQISISFIGHSFHGI